MTDTEALIAEANAHIERLGDALPEAIRDRLRAGEADDPRMSLLVRLTRALEAERQGPITDALIVDMLTAFYGEERDGWSMSKVHRMRAALEAARSAS